MLHRMSVLAFAGALVLVGSTLQAQWDDPSTKEQQARAEAASREAEARDAAVKKELAARVFAARAAAAGRAFDAEYRAAFERELAARPLGELQAIADGHAPVPPLNLGDTGADLVYTPVAPCRVLDTRFAGGPLGGGAQLHIKVAGAITGQGGAADCLVPAGPATAAVLNFVAVNAAGAGNLRAFAFGGSLPTASILNYAQVSGLNIANGVVVPLCDPAVSTCTNDLTIQADSGATQIVVDVLGYFRSTRKEQVRSFVVTANSGATTDIAATCTHYAGAEVTITAPVAGRIVVQAESWFRFSHAAGVNDTLLVNIGPTATDCTFSSGSTMAHYVPPEWPTITPRSGQVTVPLRREFVVAPGTYTYYLNATSAPATAFQFWYAGLTATFHPD